MILTRHATTPKQVRQIVQRLKNYGVECEINLKFDIEIDPAWHYNGMVYCISVKNWDRLDERTRTVVSLLA